MVISIDVISIRQQSKYNAQSRVRQAVDRGNGDVICCVHTAERVMRGVGTDVVHSTSCFCCSDQQVQGSNLAQAVGDDGNTVCSVDG